MMGSSNRTRTAPPSHDVPTLRMNRAGQPTDTPPPDTHTPLPVPPVCGDYELVRLLGRGGMGLVFLARQRGLKREVAYKVLTHVGSLDPETLGRFHGEAETLGKLQHAGIVQIFDCGTEDGIPYLAMEYVAGGSLADRLRAGRLPPREAAGVIATVAAAVGHAHAAGVIHRDLKPANILLTADGRPKVADFGLARDLASEHLTRTGMIAGTPTYMPPEQLTGRRDLTPAVDVWALGVLLYEMLAGTVPFAGENPEQILTNILQHEPVPLRGWQPNLSRDLETVCRTCLHKDPHRRYRDGQAVADDLDRFLAGRPIVARPPGAWERRRNWCRANPLAAGLTAALVVILTTATGVSVEFAERADRERQKAVAAAAAEKASREGAETVAGMMDGLFQRMDVPEVEFRREVKAQIDRTARQLLAGACQPVVRAQLLHRLTEARLQMGDWAEAVPLAEAALALRTEHLGPDHPDTYAAAHRLAYTFCHLPGRGADAVRLLEPVVAAELAALPPADPARVDRLEALAIAYHAAGRTTDYDRLADQLLALVEERHGPDHPDTHWRRVNLTRYSLAAGNYAEALPVLRAAYPVLDRETGDKRIRLLWLRRHLGAMLLAAGRHWEALDYLRPAYEEGVRNVGPVHPHMLADRRKLAAAYEGCGMYADALPLRWVALTDGVARKSLYDTARQVLRITCDLAWTVGPAGPKP